MRQLREFREHRGWNQARAAKAAGVSQAYWSMLERGVRPLTLVVRRRLVRLGLGPLALPLPETLLPAEEDVLAAALGALGYPGFAYLRAGKPGNPAELVARALVRADLDPRVTEALPWVLLTYPELDWEWLARQARLHDFQNRLGYVCTLARLVAQQQGLSSVAERLAFREAALEPARLFREDTLCQSSMTRAEQRWLEERRPAEGRHWRVLTDLSAHQLPYAA